MAIVRCGVVGKLSPGWLHDGGLPNGGRLITSAGLSYCCPQQPAPLPVYECGQSRVWPNSCVAIIQNGGDVPLASLPASITVLSVTTPSRPFWGNVPRAHTGSAHVKPGPA